MKEKGKITVMGGAGFLGSHIVDCLSDLGYEVVVFDVDPSKWLPPGQRMMTGNILDFDRVLSAVEGAKYVYHLAGVADIFQAADNPKSTIEENIMGSTNVIEACIKAKTQRLLFASTIYVYSNRGSFYRVSKQAAESIIEAYHERHGLAFTILRYGSLYGPRAQMWNNLKSLVRQAVQEGKIVYPGTGDERREYIHVKDAAKLSAKALSKEFVNECLTITGTQILTSKGLLHMIREILERDIELVFSQDNSNYNMFHYSQTPYRYTPRGGKKLVPDVFTDLGQGILEMIEELDGEQE